MMRAALRVTLILSALATVTAVAQPSEQQLVGRGKAILTAKCSRCHQINPTGQSPLSIAPPFRTVMQQYAPEDLEEALAEGLSSGHPAMPEFEFDPDEIAAIVAYLATLRATR
jgi:mono/diheme cytochrome c family protein